MSRSMKLGGILLNQTQHSIFHKKQIQYFNILKEKSQGLMYSTLFILIFVNLKKKKSRQKKF